MGSLLDIMESDPNRFAEMRRRASEASRSEHSWERVLDEMLRPEEEDASPAPERAAQPAPELVPVG